MKILILPLMLLMVLSVEAASGAEWVKVTKIRDGDVVYIDRESFRKYGNTIRAFSRIDYDKARSYQGKGYFSEIRLYEIDQTQRTATLLQYYYYAGRHGDGAMLYRSGVIRQAVEKNKAIAVIGKGAIDVMNAAIAVGVIKIPQEGSR